MSELREPEVFAAGGSYTMSLEDELEIFDRLVEDAYDLLVDWVIEREDECIEGARKRLIDNYPKYKDAAFKASEKQNVKGGGEEHQDLLNYIIFAMNAAEREKDGH